jgi:hypothetical protein
MGKLENSRKLENRVKLGTVPDFPRIYHIACHCERSVAISKKKCIFIMRLPRHYAPRNDTSKV